MRAKPRCGALPFGLLVGAWCGCGPVTEVWSPPDFLPNYIPWDAAWTPPDMTVVPKPAPRFVQGVMASSLNYLQAIAAGDWNGDGHRDLALCAGQTAPYQLTTLLGNGDGTFRPGQSGLGACNDPMTPVDVNRDGRWDLFTANVLYLGQGNGTLAARPAAGNTLCDVDGDGFVDLLGLTGPPTTGLGVYQHGLHDGTFGPAQQAYQRLSAQPDCRHTLACGGPGRIFCFSPGVGGLKAATAALGGDLFLHSRYASELHRVVSIDADLDGQPDKMTGYWSRLYDLDVSLYFNVNPLAGDIGEGQPPDTLKLDQPWYLRAAVFDLDRDGTLDYVGPDDRKGALLVFLGKTRFDLPIDGAPNAPAIAVAAADWNGDGKIDLAVALAESWPAVVVRVMLRQ